jgi:hypothetical protein
MPTCPRYIAFETARRQPSQNCGNLGLELSVATKTDVRRLVEVVQNNTSAKALRFTSNQTFQAETQLKPDLANSQIGAGFHFSSERRHKALMSSGHLLKPRERMREDITAQCKTQIANLSCDFGQSWALVDF